MVVRPQRLELIQKEVQFFIILLLHSKRYSNGRRTQEDQ